MGLRVTHVVFQLIIGVIVLVFLASCFTSVGDGSLLEGLQYTQTNHSTVNLVVSDSVVLVDESQIVLTSNGSNQWVNTTDYLEGFE